MSLLTPSRPRNALTHFAFSTCPLRSAWTVLQSPTHGHSGLYNRLLRTHHVITEGCYPNLSASNGSLLEGALWSPLLKIFYAFSFVRKHHHLQKILSQLQTKRVRRNPEGASAWNPAGFCLWRLPRPLELSCAVILSLQ